MLMACLGTVLAWSNASLSGEAPKPTGPPNKAQLQRYERDLTEIERIGLDRRAARDFQTRLGTTNYVLRSWTMGYVEDSTTYVVVSTVHYSVPGTNRVRKMTLGYKYTSGTNWVLIGNMNKQ